MTTTWVQVTINSCLSYCSSLLIELLPILSLCIHSKTNNLSNEPKLEHISWYCSSCCYLVAKSYPTLYDHMDCSPPGTSVHGFPRQEYWSELPFPSPGDLPDLRIELAFPALQLSSLPLSHQGSPNQEVVLFKEKFASIKQDTAILVFYRIFQHWNNLKIAE